MKRSDGQLHLDFGEDADLDAIASVAALEKIFSGNTAVTVITSLMVTFGVLASVLPL